MTDIVGYARYVPTGETLEVTGQPFSNVYVRHLGDTDAYAVDATSIVKLPTPPEHNYAGIYEYSATVPSMYIEPNDDPLIIIWISAAGGGTVGEAYAHNTWYYSVTVNGAEIITGDDLHTNATPAAHEEMARTLAGFLSAAGESLHHADQRGTESEYTGTYDRPAQDFLTAEYERLNMFSIDPADVES
jgi:hypothetical protein